MAKTNANGAGPEMNVDLALELFSIGGSLNSTLDLDFLLQKIGAAAEQLLDSEASAIMLVTDDKKAAVVLQITDGGYHNFRKDASCTIRPQGLIGETFIECRPTVPAGLGATRAPPPPKIAKGPGKGP